LENGFDSERGKAAIRRLNNIHSHFNISNEDFLYVLSTFVMEPVRWNARFAYRKSTQKEKETAYIFWREMAKRMNIKYVPGSFEEVEQFNLRYEKEKFAYCEGGRKVADSTLDLFLGWWLPTWLFRFGRPFVFAILDDHLLSAFHYKKPPAVFRIIIYGLMKIRAGIMAFIPLPTKPKLRTQRKNRTYPKGYEIPALGAKPETGIAGDI